MLFYFFTLVLDNNKAILQLDNNTAEIQVIGLKFQREKEKLATK